MSSRSTRLVVSSVVSSVVATVLTAGVLAGPAHARPAPSATPTASVTAGTVAAVTDQLARRLAGEFADDARRYRLFPATAARPVNLAAAPADSPLGAAVRAANRAVLAAKGLPRDDTALLTVRLADPAMVPALRRGVAPLVATSPDDDDATSVTAYDTGADAPARRVALPADRLPDRPVYLVELDAATALDRGIEVLRATLADRDLVPPAPATVAPTAGYWATQVTSIRLRDDQEPWHKGKAEIFALTAGFGLDGKATVDAVQLPYLDHDDTTYYPNQLLVHFSSYKYDLADIVLMEEDSGTNYRELALALTQALLTIVDGGVYIPLVNAILNALPDDWWVDDPDYVDSWYTLATTTSGTLTGAAANGTMTVRPYWVRPL